MNYKIKTANVRQDFNGLYISIPVKKNLFMLLFFMLWLIGWCFAEYHAVTDFINENYKIDTFELCWLVGWTIGGLFVMKTILENLFAKEQLEIKDQQLCIKNAIFCLGVSERLTTHQITEIKLNPINPQKAQDKTGKILIITPEQTFKFAHSFSLEEAQCLIQLINQSAAPQK
ncbi:hypothetical protein [uncultured Acinetobacter sp.]|uniref:hypothetical protein n=1 Tax=uncultured Acinetobacter sp. TaxID=165433 RepID=UPI002598BEAD|nr:hypothetical protein [uncultured Acinetobacter sp.]